MKSLFKTSDSVGAALLRVVLAFILFPHGAQKALGAFNGFGFAGTMDYFTNTVHLPWLLGFLVIVVEFAGTIFLLFGLATRFWSLSMALLFIGIMLTSHYQAGFFMDWFGQNPKPNNEGYEFDLLFAGAALALCWLGGGALSLDRIIQRKLNVSQSAN